MVDEKQELGFQDELEQGKDPTSFTWYSCGNTGKKLGHSPLNWGMCRTAYCNYAVWRNKWITTHFFYRCFCSTSKLALYDHKVLNFFFFSIFSKLHKTYLNYKSTLYVSWNLAMDSLNYLLCSICSLYYLSILMKLKLINPFI